MTALLVQNTNPAMVCPELHLVHAGLAREDLFTCVHEQFMTETAAFADVVLPATMFLEHDDFYTASGHTYFQVARKVIEPPGECRENHFVISELARRLGAQHPGFEMTRLGDHGRDAARVRHVGCADQLASAAARTCALPFETRTSSTVSPPRTASSTSRADWKRFGGRWQEMPVLPDHFDVIDRATADKPFRLIAAPARTFLNSTLHRDAGLARARAAPYRAAASGRLHCARRGRGDRVRLGNERGEVIVHAKPPTGQQRGVVVVEGIWPKPVLRRRPRHQRADQRRARLAERRRRVPRHGGIRPPRMIPAPTRTRSRLRGVFALLVLGLTLLALSNPLAAQRSVRVSRVGWLEVCGPGPRRPHFDIFRAHLAEHGYVEGKNLVIEQRFADCRYDRMPALATELAQLPVDVLFTMGTRAARVVADSVKTTPLVVYSCDPFEHRHPPRSAWRESDRRHLHDDGALPEAPGAPQGGGPQGLAGDVPP